MKTLEDAKSDWLYAINGDGGHCPCCDRWGKIYPRHFNSSMARALIWLVGEGRKWTDVPNTAPNLSRRLPSQRRKWTDVPNTAPKWLTRTNQLPTVRWWGLAERQKSEDPAVKHSGMWCATQRGIDFAHGRISVPQKVYTYNAEVVRFGEKNIRIEQTFKTKFDYEQVMLPVTAYLGLQPDLWGRD
mgnify:CR=1 FL=1